MISLTALAENWEHFFHAQVPAAPLALFRILCGLLLLINAVLLRPVLEEFCADHGLVDSLVWRQSPHASDLCLFRWLPASKRNLQLVIAVHMAGCCCFLLGWHFQLSAAVVFVTLVSLHHRNPWCLSSADSLLRLITLICCLSPSPAACCSIDALLSPPSADSIDAWQQQLLRILICVVYLRTVYWKLHGPLWRDGSAVWYPLWADAWVRFRPPRLFLQPVLIRSATWGVLLLEFSLAVGLWISECRTPLLVAGITMHLLFDLVLNLQCFSWIMICSLLLFLSPSEANALLQLCWPGDLLLSMV